MIMGYDRGDWQGEIFPPPGAVMRSGASAARLMP